MNSFGCRLNTILVWVVAALFLNAVPAFAGVVAYTDRTAFLAAAGGIVVADDFESYLPGPIVNNATLGDFKYSFGITVEPAVVPGGYGGQGLGGGPFDVFVGGDSVSLSYQGATALRAFGTDVLYAPSFDTISGDLYRVRVGDGIGAGSFAGSPPLVSVGGKFFLGLVADPGSEFRQVDLLSIMPVDVNGNPLLLAAYQFDDFAYAVTREVPEPTTLLLLLAAGALLAARRRIIG